MFRFWINQYSRIYRVWFVQRDHWQFGQDSQSHYYVIGWNRVNSASNERYIFVWVLLLMMLCALPVFFAAIFRFCIYVVYAFKNRPFDMTFFLLCTRKFRHCALHRRWLKIWWSAIHFKQKWLTAYNSLSFTAICAAVTVAALYPKCAEHCVQKQYVFVAAISFRCSGNFSRVIAVKAMNYARSHGYKCVNWNAIQV